MDGKAVLDHLMKTELIAVSEVKIARPGKGADVRKGLVLTAAGTRAVQRFGQIMASNTPQTPRSPQCPAKPLRDDAGGDAPAAPATQGGYGGNAGGPARWGIALKHKVINGDFTIWRHSRVILTSSTAAVSRRMARGLRKIALRQIAKRNWDHTPSKGKP